MAFILKMTDGADTIDFMTIDFHVEDGGLQITPPEEVQTWTDPSVEGGKGLVDSRIGNRDVTITFQVSGATRSEMRTKISRVNAMINTARSHSLGHTQTRVTFKYAWDDEDIVDNFEVLAGKMTLPDDVLSVEKMQSRWGDDNLFLLRGCKLELTVSPHAYGLSPSTDDLIELPLTNRNGTNVLGGIPISVFMDMVNPVNELGMYTDSFVEINGSDVAGDAPAKVRIEIAEYNDLGGVDKIMIGCHEKIDAPMYFHWTSPNLALFPGGRIGNANYVAGGNYWYYSTFFKNSSNTIFRLKIPNSYLYKSRKYRVLITSGFYPLSIPDLAPMYLQVESEKKIPLYRAPMVENFYGANSRGMVQDLGVITLPPFSPLLPNPQDVYLSLNMVAPALSDYTFALNNIWLIPVENGYRELSFRNGIASYVTSGSPIVVDDTWRNLAYVTSEGGKSISTVHAMYSPITLVPNKTQRLWFSFVGSNWVAARYSAAKVRVFYTPAYTGAV